MPNTPRKSKEWLFFPYLAGLKNSYPEILRRYIKAAKKSMLLSKHKINLLISANFRAIISQIKIEKTYHLML
jgi:hypothetical protein